MKIMRDWTIDDLIDWISRNYPNVAREYYYSLGEEE